MSTITYADANRIIAVAMQTARAAGMKPLTIVVVDAAGHITASGREDGASMFRHDIACGKAWAAAAMGMASRKLAATAANAPIFFGALGPVSQGRFIPHTGAVVIRSSTGETLGAVGASGDTGDNDELAVIAGVEGAGLQHA